jgi:hypothetical protein
LFKNLNLRVGLNKIISKVLSNNFLTRKIKMSSMGPDARQQKQLFLRSQIIIPGYSAEAFSTFLHSKRDDGCNIDTWTIPQLSVITNEFRSMNEPEEAVLSAENVPSSPNKDLAQAQTEVNF